MQNEMLQDIQPPCLLNFCVLGLMNFFGPKYKQTVVSVVFHVMTPCSTDRCVQSFQRKNIPAIIRVEVQMVAIRSSEMV